MKNKSFAILVALLVMLSLLLAGCGNGGSQASPSAPVDSPSTPDAASPSQSEEPGEATEVDAIKASGKIVMLTNASFPPFEYIEGGEVVGIDVDVAGEIAKDLGVELEILDMNFDLLIDAVKSGKGDFAAAGMTVRPDRLEQVDFSINYVRSTQMILVPADSDITADDLDGKVIAVQESTTGDFYVSDEIDAKEVLRFKSAVDAGAALSAGKCDAVVIDELPAKAIAAKSDGKLKVLDDALTEEDYAIAIKKGSALKAAIDQTLERLIAEGKLDEYAEKHMN
ncbi:MAG: ABC transporter substrate-binding protein [Christensenellales bacterium]|jgi:ABC-type amino acid transport substrate-binding protein